MSKCINDIENCDELFRNKKNMKSFLSNEPQMVHEKQIKAFVRALIDRVGKPEMVITNADIEKEIKEVRRLPNVRIIPSKIQMRYIFEKYFIDEKINNTFKRYMIKKAMRSDSGVLVVTNVLHPKPDGTEFSCPKKCSFCPTETNLEGRPTQPKSYLSSEPAMLRALKYDFDMKGQIYDRINAYIKQGNITESSGSIKLEVILSGGTFESYSYDYRNRIMTELYWAANTFGNERSMLSHEEEVEINMTAKYRIIGITIETRPDFITWKVIKDYRRWGVTHVHPGQQHYDDKILEGVNRDCPTSTTIKAIRMLKSVGMKVGCHLMPDLPGSSPELDKWMFNQAINNPDLQFDEVKVYPTAVCQTSSPDLIVTSDISDWYRERKYIPYAEKCLNDLINVLIFYKENVQPWVRIQRLVRDIPKQSIEVGYERISNLRQVIQEQMKKEGKTCNCIRCKEIGDDTSHLKSVSLAVKKYEASEGIEYFISIEAHKKFSFIDYFYYFMFLIYYYVNYLFGKKVWWSGNPKTYAAIIGFCRLRIDPNPGGGRIKELENCALIREVHVYGQSVNVGSTGISGQHRGYGQLLVKTAEELSQQHKLNKVAVIAGVGVREYYKNKCGYHLEGTYMIKNFF
jgi:ELP3 family radical SAM enzyme/protein acetyltransferase